MATSAYVPRADVRLEEDAGKDGDFPADVAPDELHKKQRPDIEGRQVCDVGHARTAVFSRLLVDALT